LFGEGGILRQSLGDIAREKREIFGRGERVCTPLGCIVKKKKKNFNSKGRKRKLQDQKKKKKTSTLGMHGRKRASTLRKERAQWPTREIKFRQRGEKM